MTGTSEQLQEIFRRAGVVVAYLFGSRARGRHRGTSDADVTVLLDGERGLLEQEAMADQLARAMSVPDVDLIVLDEAPHEGLAWLIPHAKRLGRDPPEIQMRRRC